MLEIQTHQKLTAYRLNGEWFSIASDKAIRLIQDTAVALGFILKFPESRLPRDKTKIELCAPNHLDMEPRQCRAARGLLGLTQKELAQLASVSVVTLNGFENGVTTPTRATLIVIRQALEKAGVEFTNDDQPGVRMRRKRK